MKHYYLFFLLFTTFSFAQLTPPTNLQNYYQDVDFSQTGINLFEDLAIETAVKHTNFLSYTPGIWEASKITDKDPVNPNNVLLIYGYSDVDNNYITDRSRSNSSNGGNEGTDWNREHTFPNSLASPKLIDTGRNVPPYADAHNLRPSDVKMNSNRGNLKYATNIVNGVAITNTAANISGNWYPGDEWKGDAARIIMYMYLRYGTQCKPSFATVGETNVVDSNMINLLLEWNAEDPVSIIEDQRNAYHSDATNTYGQGNRNPFIDNPYLATVIWGGMPATNRWGEDQPSDNEAPSTPAYLTASNPTSTTVDLSWEASSDNVGVTAYQVYVDGVFYVSTNGTTTSLTVSNLNPETDYQFTVLASDLANNKSSLSNSARATTLESSVILGDDCVLETFENLTSTVGANDNQYAERTWTGTNGLTWAATEARIDQTINNSKAITIRQGTLTAPTSSNGIGQLTVTTQRIFSGGSGSFDLVVNGTVIGQIAYSDILETVIIEDINTVGDINVVFKNFSSSRDRIIIEDLSWTCYEEINTDACTTESFSNLLPTVGSNDSQYVTRTWMGDNALEWTATGARIDQNINDSKVVTIRNGELTAPTTTAGIGQLTVTTQRAFSGGSGTFDVTVNDEVVGTIPYGDEAETTVIENINVSGNVSVIINNPSSTSDRVMFEDLSWTCLVTLNTDDFYLDELKVYPNPVKGNYININTNKNLDFYIYDLFGEKVKQGSISSAKPTINMAYIKQGVYILQLSSEFGTTTRKLVIQ